VMKRAAIGGAIMGVIAGLLVGVLCSAPPNTVSMATGPSRHNYASPEDIAPVATIAAEHCGQPYFGTYCR
jgi:Na+/proline symporter